MQAVSKLEDRSNVFVATLATPFLELFETNREYRFSLGTLRFFVFMTLSWADSLVWGSILQFYRVRKTYVRKIDAAESDATLNALESLNESMRDLIDFYNYIGVLDWHLKTQSVFVLAFGVVSWYLGNKLHSLLINPLNLQHPTSWQLRPRRLVEATSWDAKLIDNHLLVLRGVDDEAALSLAAGAIANRLLRFVYEFVYRPSTMVIFLLLSVTLMLSKELGIAHVIQSVIVLIAVGCLFLPSLIRPVFGRELAFGAARCDASFESAPDANRAKIVTLRSRLGATHLIHSIHQHPEAPSVMVSWIVEVFDAERRLEGKA
ncbi:MULTISPECIES: hypothetical protein [unclassified Bradyrhizobium]